MISRAMMLAAALLAVAGAARAETEIPFPKGWEMSDLPMPTVGSTPLHGYQRRASLFDEAHKPLAVVNALVVTDSDDRPGLPRIMDDASRTVVSEFRKSNLDADCTPPASLQVAGQDALRTICTVKRGDTIVVKEDLVIWLEPSEMVSLTYASPPPNYDTYAPTFEDILAAVH